MASPDNGTGEDPRLGPLGGFGRIVRSFGYAFEGVATIVRTQPNFWVHVLAACLALILGITLHLTLVELAVIVLSIALVLVVESVNTGIETMCDLISPGHHPLIKRAKDISAAAVLLSAAAAVVVALLLFGPRLASLLR
ncbi:MAG: diacylglycerol kinase family protein [Chloroflexota bacterium]